jgi:flagella basal body P-ring formation protein FlgA
MSRRTIIIIAMSVLLMPFKVKADAVPNDSTLQIYLPREASVKDEIIRLGQVSIIKGEESLVANANKITLGRFSVPGQKIIVNRHSLLSRLACNGMSSSKIILKGAEKITVKRQQQIINSADFVKQATSFLQKTSKYVSACQYEPVRIPSDLVIPSEFKDIRFQTYFVGRPTADRAKTKVTVLVDEKEIGAREVSFRLKYNCRNVVTLVELGAGETIRPDNVKIVKGFSDHPEPANWKPPYGLVTKQRLAPNTVVSSDKVVAPPATVIVKRNQNVVILIETPGLLVTATGQAMQKGHAGEYIKVRNIDSRRIILAKIIEDGTVRPAF